LMIRRVAPRAYCDPHRRCVIDRGGRFLFPVPEIVVIAQLAMQRHELFLVLEPKNGHGVAQALNK